MKKLFELFNANGKYIIVIFLISNFFTTFLSFIFNSFWENILGEDENSSMFLFICNVILFTITIVLFYFISKHKAPFVDLKAAVEINSFLGKRLTKYFSENSGKKPTLEEIMKSPDLEFVGLTVDDKINKWIIQASIVITDKNDNMLFYYRPSKNHPTNKEIRSESCLKAFNVAPKRYTQTFNVYSRFEDGRNKLINKLSLCERLGITAKNGTLNADVIREAFSFNELGSCHNEVIKENGPINYAFYIYHLKFLNIDCKSAICADAALEFYKLCFNEDKTESKISGFKTKEEQLKIRKETYSNQRVDSFVIGKITKESSTDLSANSQPDLPKP